METSGDGEGKDEEALIGTEEITLTATEDKGVFETGNEVEAWALAIS